MRVLILYTSTTMCRDGELWYHDEATAVVAACLRRAGHTVHFRTVDGKDTLKGVAGWVEAHAGEKTVLVFMTSLMFSAFGHDMPNTFEKVAPLKEMFRFPTAFIGIHATLNPEETLAHDAVDFVGRGEMEEALVEFCDALEAGRPVRHVENFWVKENGTVHRNPLRPLVASLDRLPFPARDLLPFSRMANERDTILTVVAARGCPMQCNFCSNPVLRGLYRDSGGYFRMKSVGYLLEEIRAALEENPHIRAVFFQEDVFGIVPDWTQEFLERFSREIGLPWGCNLLIRQATPSFAEALRRAGCRQVQIGIESGSPYLRNRVLNKGIDDGEIFRAVDAFREVGIAVAFYAMMGLPGETRRHFADSVCNLARFRPDMIQIQVWEVVEGSILLEHDPHGETGGIAHDGTCRDRKAWRLKFFFRYFHRLVAIHEALEAMRSSRPVLARLAARVVSLVIRFPWTPDLLLARDWNGRRRFAALWMESRWLGRWAQRWGGRFWQDVLQREKRLASLYLWPSDLGKAPTGSGWIGRGRVDLREIRGPDALVDEPNPLRKERSVSIPGPPVRG